MKKMILVAAIVCAAALAQAGSVTWSTAALYNDAGTKVKSSVTLYVYLLADQAAYDGLTDVWATYSSDIKAGGTTASASKKTGATNSKVTIFAPDGTATANTTYYAALIATIGTGDDMKYYAEKKFVTTGDDGNGGDAFGSGTIDTVAGAATAWKSASATPPAGVPEPTSGLLFLVGASLLALRRKQK